MRQLSLAYRPARTGREAWAGTPGMPGVLAALREAVDYLGWEKVVFELDVKKSTLSEAVNEKNDKRWAGEWTFRILAMLALKGEEESARIGRAILEAHVSMMPCFALVDADAIPTAEEIELAKRVLEKAGGKKRAA